MGLKQGNRFLGGGRPRAAVLPLAIGLLLAASCGDKRDSRDPGGPAIDAFDASPDALADPGAPETDVADLDRPETSGETETSDGDEDTADSRDLVPDGPDDWGPDDATGDGDPVETPSDSGDAQDPEGAGDDDAQDASSDSREDAPGPTETRDPGPPCDLDSGPCPCAGPEDCPMGAFCDGTTCRPWVCIPDSRFCSGTTLNRCSRDGASFVVQEDCDDGNPCSTGDGCEGTRCLPRTAVACDDGNPCTTDACDPTTGDCASAPADGPCEDGDPCTVDDLCVAGECLAGGALPCTDRNPCTRDFCTSLLGCVHEPAAGSCAPVSTDGCAIGGECLNGACAVIAPACDDNDPCTLDACLSGACVHSSVPGCACRIPADCDDQEACTVEACLENRCVHGVASLPGCCASDADCDDGTPCTVDRCALARCVHVPAPDPVCCTSPSLATDFEDDTAAGFELDPAGAGGVGWRPGSDPEGPGQALYFGNAAGTSYDGNGARVSGAAWSPRMTLPAGVALTLRFRTWQDVEAIPGQDPFTVQLVSPQAEATLAWSRPEGFRMREWQAVEVDLSALAGRTVRLRFGFDSLDGAANEGRGVFLDDIAVVSTCVPRSCQQASDCVSLGWHAVCQGGTCDYGLALVPGPTPGGSGSPVRFTGPSDVAVSPDGTVVYVSDRDAHNVHVLDAQGRPQGVIGSPGSAPGNLLMPRGVAAAPDRVYVADSGNHRLQAFTPAGVFLWAFGTRGDSPGAFNEPKGLGLSADGSILWVADTGNHRVQAITPWGVVRVVIGSYGRKEGEFRSPSCAVPLPDGGVLVCDTQNNRLQSFSATGVLRAVLQPTDGLALSQPYGATVAGPDGFWVSDTYNHRIVLMDSLGRVSDRYGEFGDGIGGFSYPLGMESDPAGRLWVVDSGNRRAVSLDRRPVP